MLDQCWFAVSCLWCLVLPGHAQRTRACSVDRECWCNGGTPSVSMFSGLLLHEHSDTFDFSGKHEKIVDTAHVK